MPIIVYNCECGKTLKKFFRKVGEIPTFAICECGKYAKRGLSGPAFGSKVVMDNGAQSRSVDVCLETIKSNEENSTKDFSKKD